MKRTRILLMALAAIMCVGVASCNKDDQPSNNGETNTVTWIDLGLPSGLLWADCNLGATKPEEYGNYYAWGETATKQVFDWSTYKYCTVDGEGIMQTLTKYNTSSEYGTPDNLTNLQDMDDAATASLGNGARTPTKEEWNELISNTTVEWTTVNGVYGSKFTADNGNSIFLPATGLCDGSEPPLPAVTAVTGPRRSTTSILTARSTSSSFRATSKWSTTTALAASHSAQCVPIRSNEKILLMKKISNTCIL